MLSGSGAGPFPAGSALGIATIEVTAVVAVTLLMVALAMSAYRTYSARSELSETLAEIAPVKVLVAHAFQRTGVPPASANQVPGLRGFLPQHPAVQTIAINHGRIEITFGKSAAASLRGRTLHVTPFETWEGNIVWLCGDGHGEIGLHPIGFVGGTNSVIDPVTTIEPRYLPIECR